MQLDPSLKSEYIVCNGGRRYAYTYILGLVEYVQSNYEGMNGISVLMQAIRDGAVIKDFYSAILVPVFSALICVIVFMSIYSFVRMGNAGSALAGRHIAQPWDESKGL